LVSRLRVSLDFTQAGVARDRGNFVHGASDLRREFEQINYERALESSYESRMYLFCYSERRFELFQKHGLGTFIGESPSLVLKELPNLLLETIDVSLMSEDIPGMGRFIRAKEIITDASNVVDAFSKMLGSGKSPLVPKLAFDRRADELDLDQLVRQLYHVAVTAKRVTQTSIDHCAKSLLVIAFVLDIERAQRGRNGGKKKQKRLVKYMPTEAMDRLLSVLKVHPLHAIIQAWNEGNHDFTIIDGNR
jgi:hypothetical protein